MSLPDEYIFKNGGRDFLLNLHKLDEDSILFQRSWNELGVEVTNEVFITGTRKESEFFLNGNLQYECTYKGKNKHGIEWWFDEQRNPLKINFNLNGKTLISHEIQYN